MNLTLSDMAAIGGMVATASLPAVISVRYFVRSEIKLAIVILKNEFLEAKFERREVGQKIITAALMHESEGSEHRKG